MESHQKREIDAHQRQNHGTGGCINNSRYKWKTGGDYLTPQARQDFNRRSVAYKVKEDLFYFIHIRQHRKVKI